MEGTLFCPNALIGHMNKLCAGADKELAADGAMPPPAKASPVHTTPSEDHEQAMFEIRLLSSLEIINLNTQALQLLMRDTGHTPLVMLAEGVFLGVSQVIDMLGDRLGVEPYQFS
jgi:hypothetical protein